MTAEEIRRKGNQLIEERTRIGHKLDSMIHQEQNELLKIKDKFKKKREPLKKKLELITKELAAIPYRPI